MKALNICHTFAWIPALCCAIYLNGCATKEGKQAHTDAVAIGRNNATAQTATKQAQTANDAAQTSNQSTGDHLHRAQTLLERIDAKDKVLSEYGQ